MSTIANKWPSGFIFIVASIGAAAGLGNLWRFPYLAYENGGAAFVIAMIVTNLVIGIPLFMGETATGQATNTGPQRAFGELSPKLKRFNLVGWIPVVCSFVVLTYYIAIMAWAVRYLLISHNLGWGSDTETFFLQDTLNLSAGPGEVGMLAAVLITPLLLAWLMTIISIRNGVETLSKIVVWTATIPFVTLFVLLVRAVTLPGSEVGLQLFLSPDWSALMSPGIWIAAVSQTFFSLGVAFGIAYVYAKYNEKNFNIFRGTMFIAIGNFAISILSGFVVFGVLGYMAGQQGVAVTEVVASGPTLTFITIPLALTLIPVAGSIFAVLFFGSVIMLALDSAFALLEVAVNAVKNMVKNLSYERATYYTAIPAVAISFFFITGGGLYYLDIVDHFITQYLLVLFALFQAIIFGWALGRKEDNMLVQIINRTSRVNVGGIWIFLIRFIIPPVLVGLFVLALMDEFAAPYGGYPLWALLTFGLGSMVLTVITAALLEMKARKEARA